MMPRPAISRSTTVCIRSLDPRLQQRIKKIEHIRLPRGHASVDETVSIARAAADGRIDLQAMR
jgi:hypothetical protein